MRHDCLRILALSAVLAVISLWPTANSAVIASKRQEPWSSAFLAYRRIFDEDTEILPRAIAVGAAFLAGFTAIEMASNIMAAAPAASNPRPAIANAPGCGRVDNLRRYCDRECQMVYIQREILRPIIEVTLPNSNIVVELTGHEAPYSMPLDMNCLNTCVCTPTLDRKSSEFFQSRRQSGYQPALAFYEFYSLKDENNRWVFDMLKDSLFTYCLLEQIRLNPGYNPNSSPIRSEASICNVFMFWDVNACNGQRAVNGVLPKKKRRKGEKKNKFPRQFDDKIVTNRERGIRDKSPWACSLRTRGFRGEHKCGVTLLGYDPEAILVSAAHCNFVCKDKPTLKLLETCCCRAPNTFGSCQLYSSYCGTEPQVFAADPADLQIVCGEYSLERVPEFFSPEKEVVLSIREIINHPGYKTEDPVAGNDLAVYKIRENLRFTQIIANNGTNGSVYPACLPNNELPRFGLMNSWNAPTPTFYNSRKIQLGDYVQQNFHLREFQLERTDTCSDPEWMQSNTYYPPGVICYRQHLPDQCIGFGSSGAGIMEASQDNANTFTVHWMGALSFHKGCDRTRILFSNFANADVSNISFFQLLGENPGVYTDGRCFIDWIADQYGLDPPAGWVKPQSCDQSHGDKNDANRTRCQTDDNGIFCDLTNTQCSIPTAEGLGFNVFRCNGTDGNFHNCANNCRGVDGNNVIVGGVAVAFAASTVAVGSLAPFAGPAIAASLIGVGGAATMGLMMMNQMCLPLQCRTAAGQCCDRVRAGTRNICPNQC